MSPLDPRLARVLLLIAIFAVYMPLMSGGFVWDDHLLVVENQLTGSLANIPQMFMTDLWSATPVPEAEPGYYRPLMLVDLAITRAIAGLNHHAHHLHNLLWHGLAVILLMRLLEHLLKDRLAAVLGAAVFALHPVQIEAVGFISARNDPMAVAWLLVALLLLSPERPGTKALLLGAGASAAAMLSKESVVFAPLLLAFAARARWGGWGTRGAHVAVVSGFAVAIGCRVVANVGWPAQADLAHLSAVGAPSLAFYLEKLVWPVDIAPVIHFGWLPAVPWFRGIMAMALLALLAAAGGPFARAGLGFALLGLLPAWAAVAHVGAVVDRYLYLPMVGIAWAVAAVAQRPIPRKVVFVVLGALTLLSMRQVPVWKNEATLWRAAIARAPSGYAKGALARWLEDQGMDDDAAHWYREAVIQTPRPFHESCFNVTRIHLKRGDPAAAVAVGQEALDAGCAPSAELVAPLALAHALTGEWSKAQQLAATVGQDPTGKAVIASLAASVALGDAGPLQAAMNGATPEQARRLKAQVMQVLTAGGAEVDAVE
jgi:protein O-mannosyl-transferase